MVYTPARPSSGSRAEEDSVSATERTQILAAGMFAGDVARGTGGGTCIGLAVARELGALGAKVALCGRRPEPLVEAAALLSSEGVESFHATCDIREPDAVGALVDAVM